jgi:hypothetical protein
MGFNFLYFNMTIYIYYSNKVSQLYEFLINYMSFNITKIFIILFK